MEIEIEELEEVAPKHPESPCPLYLPMEPF